MNRLDAGGAESPGGPGTTAKVGLESHESTWVGRSTPLRRTSPRYARGRTLVTAVAILCLTFSNLQTLRAQGLFDSRGQIYSFSGVDFPSVVDTFAVLEAVRFPQVELGVSLQYSSPIDPAARFSLFVYPVRPDADGADPAMGEFERALEDVQQYAAQNRQRFRFDLENVDSVAVVDDSGRTHSGWLATAEAREGGRSERSLLYVFVKDGSYFKYRLSYSLANAEEMRPRAEFFVRQTLDLIAQGQ